MIALVGCLNRCGAYTALLSKTQQLPGYSASLRQQEVVGVMAMAHGERAERLGHSGREYWSRRPGFRMGGWGRVSKLWTHRKERRLAAREARAALKKLSE